jgi:hypothetical protein
MAEYRGVEVFGRQTRRGTSPPTRRASRPTRRADPPPRLRSRLGLLGFGAALVTTGSTVTGICLALGNHYEASILLAYLATGASVVAFLCGVAAVLTARGRAWGAVAIVLGVLSSPPVLTKLLAWASGLG